ncbi:ECF RNA polymerase sigma factor SigE [Aquisphaera giovannonii]|uniref:ECF RNA polymerase sigma factor SigE n=1 Tax=Aquisphaera giovannonii TaxID=406548 RepID=A0A5B9W6E7_9BACT|nr:sigma-70 family RNA polymerase sigma factor [Aquisphaera giovannonii]QEH35550.1 ECF RNA polymerase sigma factor SigE [Aquisphaera giovannonii]
MGATIEDDGSRSLVRGVDRVFRDGTVAGLPEAELVRRFAEEGQEAAFAAIVERHGPMVLGVCRRILGPLNEADADDAFQATFLVLIRRRRALEGACSLGPWLHGVARRVASRARTDALRRRAREPLAARLEAAALPPERPAERVELWEILDEEIGRLPEKYRQAVILCDLEGLPQEDAARRLRWTAGALRGRLDRARAKLRGRLARRGLLPAAVAATVSGWPASTAEAAVSPSLRAATAAAMARDLAVESVARAVSPSAAARLAAAFLRRQVFTRSAVLAAFLLIAAALSAAGIAAVGRAPRPDREALATRPDGETRDVEIQVVGPDGRAIPNAPVSLRTYPVLNADDVRRGSFARRDGDAAVVDADVEGRLAVRLPANGNDLDVTVSIPGYGLYNADWLSRLPGQEMPNPLRIQLEKAQVVNGIVADPDGKPVEGARVLLDIPSRIQPRSPGHHSARAFATTDRAGRWRYDRVPESAEHVSTGVLHSGFLIEGNVQISPDIPVGGDLGPANRLTLRRGQVLAGTVRDEAGKPIAGARVRVVGSAGVSMKEVTTGPDGTFRAEGCPPGTPELMATAPGRAMGSRTVPVGPGPYAPVDLTLQPARPLRVRVVDHTGKPVSNAVIDRIWVRNRIEPQDFGGVIRHTDAEGRWEWGGAPRDEITFEIAPPGEMQRTKLKVAPRDELQELRLPPPLIVTGRVIDADSRRPIGAFRVVPGSYLDASKRIYWTEWQASTGTAGHFEYRPGRRGDDIRHLVRVEADGYEVAESREVRSDEGSVSLDFALKQAHGIIGRVITPDNRPAAGARVATLKGAAGIWFKNGDFEDPSTAYFRTVIADPAGTFRVPLPKENFRLAIVHPTGQAWVDPAKEQGWDRVRLIRLEPWSRVEGTFRVGSKPVANARLSVEIPPLRDGNRMLLAMRQSEATTGPDGRFLFERVFPGRWTIGRHVEPPVALGAEGASSGVHVEADFPAGRTTRLDLGGAGRAVVGRLRLAEGIRREPPWDYAWIRGAPLIGGEERLAPNFRATAGPDGRFRIDDLPPGRYRLHASFSGIGDVRGPRGVPVSCQFDFEVPPEGREPAGKEVDLGTLTLDEP